MVSIASRPTTFPRSPPTREVSDVVHVTTAKMIASDPAFARVAALRVAWTGAARPAPGKVPDAITPVPAMT
jgi:hypothetical protein